MKRLLAVLLASGVLAGAAGAQSVAFVPPAHWTLDAVRRIGTTGYILPVSDPAQLPVTVDHALRIFEHAEAAAAAAGDRAVSELAAGYAARLERELRPRRMLERLELAAGVAGASDEVLAGSGFFQDEDWVGARPLPDVWGPAAQLLGSGGIGTHVAWFAALGYAHEEFAVAEAGLTARVGPIQAWAGRHALWYGMGRSGSVVLGGRAFAEAALPQRGMARFEGAGLFWRDPIHIPLLRRFTVGRLELFGGRLDREGLFEKPYIIGGRLIGHPLTDRITLGIYRTAIFGGNDQDVTLRHLWDMLIGNNPGEEGEFDNQVMSIALGFRPPLGRLPLEIYGEWGADDAAGALFDVPAIVAGAEVGMLPGAPHVGLGAEIVRMAPSCCGNPPWYRNVYSRGTYSEDGRILGHPLGGAGTEVSLYGSFDRLAGGSARFRLFGRERGVENSYAPGRDGRSAGAQLRLEDVPRFGPASLLLEGTLERGEDWTLLRLLAAARLYL